MRALAKVHEDNALVARAQQFDYGLVDPDDAEDAVAATVRIISLETDMRSNAWELANEIYAQKERIGHGKFGEWLRDVLEWEPRRAQMWLSIRERWSSKEEYMLVSHLSLSTQQLLAAPSTPDVAVEIIAKADSPMTVRQVKDVIVEQRTLAGNAPKKREIQMLSVEATADILRRYAKHQAHADRYDRVDAVAADSLASYLPRGFQFADSAFGWAKRVVLSELRNAPADPLPSPRAVEYSPDVTVNANPALAYRITLPSDVWDVFRSLGDGDITQGLINAAKRLAD